jgi:hypothetical protein
VGWGNSSGGFNGAAAVVALPSKILDVMLTARNEAGNISLSPLVVYFFVHLQQYLFEVNYEKKYFVVFIWNASVIGKL